MVKRNLSGLFFRKIPVRRLGVTSGKTCYFYPVKRPYKEAHSFKSKFSCWLNNTLNYFDVFIVA